MRSDQRHLLLILDGYGIAEDPSVSAIDAARKPYLDHLFATVPHGTLEASGLAVGLPGGQMGNSEVGHMNLGAGRVVYQDITRIDRAVADGSMRSNEVLLAAIDHARSGGGRLHFLGLFSDGGVHSHVDHLVALVEMAADRGLGGADVLVHAFTDGRDTDPHGGARYVREYEDRVRGLGTGRIATVVGRYYAMDRDRRWERTRRAYDLLVEGEGAAFASAAEALEASYADGVTDEFVLPRRVGGVDGRVRSGDAIVFFNFRADRGRQLTRAFIDEPFDGFERGRLEDLFYVTLTPYDETFDVHVAFPKVNLARTLGEIISTRGGTQLRAAETEKYPHVTFFFSGGREQPFPGEERILVPSPKVATYDLQPEMSAPELAARVARHLVEHPVNFAVVNFANPDMVGHTGVFEAAVRAVETVDAGTREIVEAARSAGYGVSIIADHGNADRMRNPDGSPHTAHTTALVPHLVIHPDVTGPVRHGKLGDIAPTILHLLGEAVPDEMTGEILV
jgi:2,3-bisphosphoglycerate-independent phosphoglycerate mutase